VRNSVPDHRSARSPGPCILAGPVIHLLTSEFFLDDKRFVGEVPLTPDPELRAAFYAADKQAQDLAQLRLKTNLDDYERSLRACVPVHQACR
jgi:hypothetical protein